MFGRKNLNQEGGNNSSNLQGQNVTINNGISYSDAKEIALDVFKSNFLELSQTAATIAKQRAEELVDNFLGKLQEKDPSKIERIQDPDMQYAIFTAQKEYARSGEKNMEEMLVNLLLERIEENTQSLKKIVLNESLEVLPKLTNRQLDILTIVFLIQETKNNTINNKESLKNYLETHFLPFLNDLTTDKASYKHLEFTGCCGTIGLAEDSLPQIFINNYRGIFSRGFEKSQFDAITGGDISFEPLLRKCINDDDLYQLNVMNDDVIKQTLTKLGKDQSLFPQFKSLLDNHTMSKVQAKDYLIELLPQIGLLIDVWGNSYMCAMNPTSVGIMLAYINLKRKAGISIDINIWIK